jgi:AraC-like DNA-binding protein
LQSPFPLRQYFLIVRIATLQNLPLAERRIVFPRHHYALSAMLTSCGHQREISTEYRWPREGISRGEYCILQYTLSGRGRLRHEGQTHELDAERGMLVAHPGDYAYWLPADSPHWEFLYVCMNGKEVVRMVKDLIRRRGPALHLSPGSATVRAMERIIRQVVEERLDSPYQASAAAYELTMALLDDTSHDAPAGERPEWIGRVIESAKARLAEPIGVGELAAVSGYSRHHFSRLFKAWMGLAPGDYLLRLRLRESARLLQGTDRTVKEICFESGFNDANYFSKAFRRNYGMSPGAFRHSARQ